MYYVIVKSMGKSILMPKISMGKMLFSFQTPNVSNVYLYTYQNLV